jgi:hypothetical protein
LSVLGSVVRAWGVAMEGVVWCTPLASTVVAAGLFLVLAVAKTFPLARHLGTHVPSDLLDPLFNAWVLAWGVRALGGDPHRFFDANIAYPVELSLAFSDHLLGVLPIAGPVLLVTGNPLAAYNMLFLLSFAISSLSAFCLARYWTRAFWPSMVAGVLYGFAPWRLGQVAHLQLLGFFWAPLALLFLDRTLRHRRWRDLGLFAFFWWLQVLASSYLAYMVTVGAILYVGHYVLVVDRTWWARAMLSRVLAFAAVSVVVLLPVHLAYTVVAHRWEATRALSSVAAFSADLVSFAAPPALMNDVYRRMAAPILPFTNHETLLFPGFVAAALVLLGSRSPANGLQPAEARRLRVASWIMISVALVLALGPWLTVLGWRTLLPLPYQIPYYLVPGWDVMRAPARFMLLALLGAIPLIALGAARVGTLTRHPALAALALIGLFLVELGAKPLLLVAVPPPSPAHHWLAAQRPGPVVELPLNATDDLRWQYFSTVHWLPLVNGRSGFWPRALDELQTVLSGLPGAAARRTAAALGVAAIVVHGDKLTADEGARWEAAERAGAMRRLATFQGDVVYSGTVDPVVLSSVLLASLDTPAWLPPGRTVRLGLILRGEAGRAWRYPGPQGLARADVEWKEHGSARVVRETVRVALPFAVAPGETAAVSVRMTAPSTPGVYDLRLAFPAIGLIAGARAFEIREAPLLTSAEGPRLLGAQYTSTNTALVCAPFESFLLPVEARNTGGALWLARATQNRGAVRFIWRWTPEGGTPLPFRDAERIRYDVFPGQTYRTELSIDAPGTRGRYMLEVGLTSEGVTSFADVGTPAARFSVDIRR